MDFDNFVLGVDNQNIFIDLNNPEGLLISVFWMKTMEISVIKTKKLWGKFKIEAPKTFL